MKIGTRQYARRQVKWICNKLLPAIREQEKAATASEGPCEMYLYALDATGERYRAQSRRTALTQFQQTLPNGLQTSNNQRLK